MGRSKLLLVTGATGFVGRAVVRRAISDGWALRACSRSSAEGWPAGVRPMAGLQLAPDTDWNRALEGVQVVVHCAGRAHVLKDLSTDPMAEFRRINALGTKNLATQSAQKGVKRFIFISSIGVNGTETFGTPFSPSDVPAPQTPYAQSKYEAELVLRKIAAETGMEIVIIRPPLIYGPGAPGNFARLLRAVRLGIPLPLSRVDNRRSLVALDNVVDLVASALVHPKAINRTLLVSDGNDVSTTELLHAIAAALGRSVRLFPVPVSLIRAGATIVGKRELAQQLCGSLQIDLSETRALLDWAPPVEFGRALREAVQASCTH